MNFFSGLSFCMAGSKPKNTTTVHNEPKYYSIQFNYHGPLRLRIDDGREYRVDGPYAFLTYPGRMFDYGSVNGMPRHHNFVCTCGERIRLYLESGLFERFREQPLVHIVNPEIFLKTMYEIMTLTRQPGAVPPRAVLLFEDLLLRMHESARAELKPPPYQAGHLNALIEKVCAAPEQNWNFLKEAEKCHITPTHFRRLFKELAGLPPQQFLIQSRLHKAAALLLSTSDTVKEIAHQTGWDNVFYFSRLFHQKYQVSPQQYRKEFHF